MRVAVVDDEQEMRELLCGYISRYAEENALNLQAVQFPSGDALLSDYQAEYSVIIFDVDMPGTNGIDTARQVRAMDDQVVILFITNIAQYAINGYEVEAVDYVIKPVSYYDFALKFRRALRRVRQKRADCLVLGTVSGPVQVEAASIHYVEVLDHYLIYHTEKGTYQVRGSIREHAETLREHRFSRCHKSYMVNLSHVKTIRASGVVLDDVVVPLGRTYKEPLMEDYIRFLHG